MVLQWQGPYARSEGSRGIIAPNFQRISNLQGGVQVTTLMHLDAPGTGGGRGAIMAQ